MERWEAGLRRLELNDMLVSEGFDPTQLMLDEAIYNRMVVFIELGHDEVEDVCETIRHMIETGHTQWGRPKKRTKRWAFNFPPDFVDSSDEREYLRNHPVDKEEEAETIRRRERRKIREQDRAEQARLQNRRRAVIQAEEKRRRLMEEGHVAPEDFEVEDDGKEEDFQLEYEEELWEDEDELL